MYLIGGVQFESEPCSLKPEYTNRGCNYIPDTHFTWQINRQIKFVMIFHDQINSLSETSAKRISFWQSAFCGPRYVKIASSQVPSTCTVSRSNAAICQHSCSKSVKLRFVLWVHRDSDSGGVDWGACSSLLACVTGSNPIRALGCLFLLTVVCCQIEVSSPGWSFV